MRASTRHVVPLVTATVFLDLVGFGIVLPLLPLYVDHMGGTSATVGALLSSFALAQLVATPLLGRASDRFGRRSVILLSLAGNVAAMIIFARAAEARYLPLLFVSRILAGATSGNLSACQAAIADTSEGPARTEGMGRLGAGISLGMMIGPFLGGMFSKFFGEPGPPLAAAAFAFVDLVAVAVLMPETRARRTRTDDPPTHDVIAATVPKLSHASVIFADKRIVVVLLLYFMTFLCMSDMQVGYALLANTRLALGPPERSARPTGSSAPSCSPCRRLLVGRLSTRMRPLDLLRWWRDRCAPAAALVIMGVSFDAVRRCWPGSDRARDAASGWSTRCSPRTASEYAGAQSRGTVLGFAQSAGGLARTVGPLAWGHRVQARRRHRLVPRAARAIAVCSPRSPPFAPSRRDRTDRLAAPAELAEGAAAFMSRRCHSLSRC